MTILVFSDTHGRTEKMTDIILSVKHDLVLHLGDCVSDILEIERTLPNEKIRYVPGNDLHDVMMRLPKQQIFMERGAVIFMTHGQEFSVRYGTGSLYNTAQQCGAQLALYGHTHVPRLETKDGMKIMNPGSLELDRSGLGGSYGVAEIDGGKIDCRIEYV